MGTIDIQLVLGVAVALVLVAIREQVVTARLRKALSRLTSDVVDDLTSMLPQAAIPLRLEPELQWAQHEHRQFAVVVVRAQGGNVPRAARSLRAAMRSHENAFLLGANRFLLGLWDVDAAGAEQGVVRFCGRLRDAGCRIVEAGFALCPSEGTDIDALIQLATQEMLPLSDYGDGEQRIVDSWIARHGPRRIESPLLRSLQLAADNWLGIAMSLALVLLPFALMRPLWLLRERPPGMALAVVAALSIPLAIVGRAAWRIAFDESVDRSTVMSSSTVLVMGTIFAVMAPVVTTTPFAGVIRSEDIAMTIMDVSVSVLLVIAFLQLRHMITASLGVLAGVLALGVVATNYLYGSVPQAANVSRFLAAAAIGVIIARLIEHLSWVPVVAVLIGASDAFSVYSSHGVTHKIVSSHQSSAMALLDRLAFTGPVIDDSPIYWIGTTDLIFLAAFLFTAVVWSLGIVRNIVGIVLSLVAASSVSVATDAGVPVLPFLAMGFVLTNGSILWTETRRVFESASNPRTAESSGSQVTDG